MTFEARNSTEAALIEYKEGLGMFYFLHKK